MNELNNILQLAQELQPAELPHFLGTLEEARQIARLRLTPATPAPAPPDELLNIRAAAQRLGCSTDFLYKKSFPFTRRLGRKLMFSRNGIAEYLKKQS